MEKFVANHQLEFRDWECYWSGSYGNTLWI